MNSVSLCLFLLVVVCGLVGAVALQARKIAFMQRLILHLTDQLYEATHQQKGKP